MMMEMLDGAMYRIWDKVAVGDGGDVVQDWGLNARRCWVYVWRAVSNVFDRAQLPTWRGTARGYLDTSKGTSRDGVVA